MIPVAGDPAGETRYRFGSPCPKGRKQGKPQPSRGLKARYQDRRSAGAQLKLNGYVKRSFT
jgi:hypothetical protein